MNNIRMNDHWGHQQIPVPYLDRDPSFSQTRTRNPIACDRCRKRKIKCTGDATMCTPCSECISARESATCYYRRVNSFEPANRMCQGEQNIKAEQMITSQAEGGSYAPYGYAQPLSHGQAQPSFAASGWANHAAGYAQGNEVMSRRYAG
ncbi:hypothetical protein K490DRAFT_54853 [Saccharata proteae CBS 121410]|uniref:Zn(2)-C6 fungal-type domain-containing protein n=1 Tax=Saccharata proteae CBS 121410 TaxID=1314787 RepID=A0A6A5YBX5_9PEZI|nr:hypothetical protein K490DRAFT_54853 [Saccharata proteae CBS 121410]